MASFDRNEALNALRDDTFDVVVVGAGMTGTGVAVDAATRGFKVALIEAGDFAEGTSSKSSKMVHGGLRYLQQREFRLVYENLRERQRLMTNAPHLVRVLPFLIPLFGKDGVVSKTVAKSYATALRLYDITGGWRIGRRYQKVTREQALEHLPSLKVDKLVAGFLYFDARGDDARVALTLARTASDHGAVVANYLRATGFLHDERGAINAVLGLDVASNEELVIRTKAVVNATGVWADEIFTMAEGAPSRRITPAKGVHVTVPSSRLAADVAAVLAVPGDRRSIFVVPFEEAPFTYVGTTDTEFNGDIDQPLCTPEDVDYLLRTVNAWTSSDLSTKDVTGVWAGLRPLLAPEQGEHLSERTADLSRRHKVIVNADGVIHITGGKWTTYRQMAEDTVDALCRSLGTKRKCRTERLALHGAPKDTGEPTEDRERHLHRRFGTDRTRIAALISSDPTLGDEAIPGLPFLKAEFVYSATEEMSLTLIDLLTRRTRAHLIDARATKEHADAVSRLVAGPLGWDDARRETEVARYFELVDHEFAAAGLPTKGDA